MNLLIISLWTQGKGMSGGDNIWISLAKSWKNHIEVDILSSPEAKEISKRRGLSGVGYREILKPLGPNNLKFHSLFKNLFSRTLLSLWFVWINISELKKYQYVYTSSDFWPDSLSGVLIKILNPSVVLISGYYLLAPSPFSKESPYKGVRRWTGLFYYLMQMISYPLVNRFADYVFITSEPDAIRFSFHRPMEKVVVVRGGIDIETINEYCKKHKSISPEMRSYDAVFMGRLHVQKGVIELVDIWKHVVDSRPQSILAIVGDGELEKDLLKKIHEISLEKNIKLMGYKEGNKKYSIFANSRIAVHPATYDSGGMAIAEPMAFGLPGVSFDLESLKTYYHQGILKVECFNTKEFAKAINHLLNNRHLYQDYSRKAMEETRKRWGWTNQADKIYDIVFKR